MKRFWVLALFFAVGANSYAYAQARVGCMTSDCVGTNGAGSNNKSGGARNSQNNAAASMMNSMQNNLQNTNQMINAAGAAILNALQQNNNSDSDTESAPAGSNDSGSDSAGAEAAEAAAAARAAAAEAAFEAGRRREEINNEASQILQDSQSYLDSTTGATAGEGGSPNAAAAVNSLLDSALPPSSSNSAINSLLGDSNQSSTATATPAAAVANLLDINKVSDAASVFPAYMPLATPADPQFAAAMQDSVNQPDPSTDPSLLRSLQGVGQRVEDKLTGIVSSSRALASSVLDNRFVQWAASDKGNFTTVPQPVASDSPDTAASLVYGQSVVGFGTILKECVQYGPSGCAKGIKEYGTAMVDQMGADLGYAEVNIVQSPNSDPNH